MNLSRRTIYRVFMRSMLIQACWNFENMQSVGFLYSILPGLREIYAHDPSALRDAAKRHMEFFNTHPYFSSPLIGMSLAMEDKARRGEISPGDINSAKVGLMGSLGAIGDSCFWGSLKPLASLIAVLLSLLNPFLGLATLLILFNYFHLKTRIDGYRASLESPSGIFDYLKKKNFAEKNEYFRALVMIFLGLYLGLYIASVLPYDRGWISVGIQLGVSVGLVIALEFVYRKIAATTEIVVFSAMFVVLISQLSR